MNGPNILLLTADDMNADTPGCFGGPAEATPTIDALAAGGMRFRRAHVSIAICQPSRSVLMTGRYPHRNGAEGFQSISDDVPLLTDLLRAAGYRCGILGKVSHLAPVQRFAWDHAVDQPDLGLGRDPSRYRDEARLFLAGGGPWFLMCNAHDPHRPFHGSDDEVTQFGESLRQAATPSHVFKEGDWPAPGFLPDLQPIRREVAQYLSSSRRADDVFAAVLDAVAASGAEDDTLVVFLSDNGMSFPFAKSNCYLHSTRTPLVVRWRGVTEPGSVDEEHYVAGIDLLPTLCEAVGVPVPDGVDGRSFVPLLRGGRQHGRDGVHTVFHETVFKKRYEMRCVQDRRGGYIWNAWSDGDDAYLADNMMGLTWRAMVADAEADPSIAARVEHYSHRMPEELYDFERDPDALVNLARDPAHAALLADKRAELLSWMMATGDPLLDRYESFLA